MVVGGWISCECVKTAKFPWPFGGPINGFHYYKLKLIAQSWAYSNTTNKSKNFLKKHPRCLLKISAQGGGTYLEGVAQIKFNLQ